MYPSFGEQGAEKEKDKEKDTERDHCQVPTPGLMLYTVIPLNLHNNLAE